MRPLPTLLLPAFTVGAASAARPDTVGHPLLGEGICAGARIATTGGLRAVEALRPGTELCDADGRGLRLLHVARRTVPHPLPAASPDHAVLRIRAGTFGEGRPVREVHLASGTRLLFVGPAIEELCGETGMLVAAGLLADGLAVTRAAPGGPPLHCFGLVAERPGFLLAEGLAVEVTGPDGPGPPLEPASPAAAGKDPAQLRALMRYLARLA